MTIHVSAANGEKQERALRVLFHDMLPEELQSQINIVQEANKRGDLQLEGLYLAEEQGEDVGACLTLTQRDRSAFVWPPVVLDAINWERVGSALLQEIQKQQDVVGVLYAQAMLDPDALDERSLLEKNGFEPLAELYFMECQPDRQKTTHPQLRAGKECRSTSLEELGETGPFREVLERTYEETLDVPQFNLMRSGEESLESHRLNGPFDPALWFLYYVGDTPAGLILLRNYDADDRWEVAYMGVVPEHRGTGLGTFMLQEAVNRARALQRSVVFLAVDSRNHFALEIYERIGFQRMTVKQVLIRP
ncbi:Mycothiol acetyltransferase [Polystyrenella longa]|uniref:Mycothiol acetyltransferase n=1 Tax=Polystyrenella longa TaxID=2528007 RepID=A0A518CHH4_9PLAN|nr:GNAT family N-acetyltransferase [Polystyrenella longa]QDU78677.1 Mycothiol acetyltransferase [Polystyrenella longa]